MRAARAVKPLFHGFRLPLHASHFKMKISTKRHAYYIFDAALYCLLFMRADTEMLLLFADRHATAHASRWRFHF